MCSVTEWFRGFQIFVETLHPKEIEGLVFYFKTTPRAKPDVNGKKYIILKKGRNYL